MAVQDILKKIKADAEANASEIVAEGKAAGSKVLADAQKDIDAQKEKLLSRARQHADEERNRIITLARLAARRELLGEKLAAGSQPGECDDAVPLLVGTLTRAGEKLLLLRVDVAPSGGEHLLPGGLSLCDDLAGVRLRVGLDLLQNVLDCHRVCLSASPGA